MRPEKRLPHGLTRLMLPNKDTEPHLLYLIIVVQARKTL